MGFWQKIIFGSKPQKTSLSKKPVQQLSPEQLRDLKIRFSGGVPLPPIPADAKAPPQTCSTCNKPLEKKGDVPICPSCSAAWCPRCGTRLFGATVSQCYHCHVAWCASCFRIPEYYMRHRLGVSMPCCRLLGYQIIEGVK